MSRVIYFIESAGLIKIGRTNNIERRMKELRNSAGSPIKLIGTVPGGVDLETRLHRELSGFRRHGEWFEDAPALRAAIETELENPHCEEVRKTAIEPIAADFDDPLSTEFARISVRIFEICESFAAQKDRQAFKRARASHNAVARLLDEAILEPDDALDMKRIAVARKHLVRAEALSQQVSA